MRFSYFDGGCIHSIRPMLCKRFMGKGLDGHRALGRAASRGFRVVVPIVWVRVEPIKNPDCIAVRDEFFRRFDHPYHEETVWCRQDDEGWHATGTLQKAFMKPRRRSAQLEVSEAFAVPSRACENT